MITRALYAAVVAACMAGRASAQPQAGGQPVTWGAGTYGQLGSGLTSDRLSPGDTIRLPKCTAAASGVYHTLFLTSDGRVLAAGHNEYGQLGDGSALGSSRAAPLAVPGITNAVAVAAGAYHSLALLADGTVMAWGYNAHGQLGDGTTTDRATPTPASGLASVTHLAAGGHHSVAVLSGGAVYTWGYNADGQVGNGTTTDRPNPGPVVGLTGVVAVAAGAAHTLALKSDGAMRAWGHNGHGQLGDGSTTNASTPVAVSGITAAVSIGAGSNHSLAVLVAGAVQAWGSNSGGQLGDGSTTSRPLPVAALGITTATAVAAGEAHSAARLSNGTVATWGADTNGVLGNGAGGDTLVPQPVPGLSGIASICSSNMQCHAVTAGGAAFGWGSDAYGSLGEGGSNFRSAPAPICALDSAVQVAMGEYHTLAVREDGALFAWGHNGFGQLGDGTLDSSVSPRYIGDLPPVTAVAAGSHHSVLLINDGTLRTFGYGGDGQLGHGLMVDSSVPVVVPGITTATQVSASVGASYALLADGTVWAWGDNTYGQLGDPSVLLSTAMPVAVVGLSGVKAIAAGPYHVLALLTNGTVVAWGLNGDGQLGDGGYTTSYVPVPVLGLTNVVGIAAGLHHSLAVLADGTVRAWGYNGDGQLGDGTGVSSPTPVVVTGLFSVTAVASRHKTSLALHADGEVSAWGYNGSGQIGDGTTTQYLAPVWVPDLRHVTAVASSTLGGIAISHWPSTTLTVPSKSGARGQSITLGAVLLAFTGPVVGRTVTFKVNGSAVGSAVTDGAGIAGLAYTIPDALPTDNAIEARFVGDDEYKGSAGAGTLTLPQRVPTSVFTVDRTGIITTTVALKGYLKRTSDNAWLVAKTVGFTVAGSNVGSATTDAGGQAILNYVITTSAGPHTIGASFAGDAQYQPSSSSATLTATTTNTKVYVVDRTAKIKTYVVLKSYLYTPTNAIIPGKPMTLKLDGTVLGSGTTNASGYYQFGYTVAEGSGTGNRIIRGEFPGDGGYMASANTGKLTVTAGDLYIWPYVRSGKVGIAHPLRAYVRSLPDYVIQPGKSITFKVNGSTIGSAAVAADGWATVAWNIPIGEATGSHTATAEFAGDSWYQPVTASTTFNAVP